nr:MAG TPA: Large polyvalent protein associated domain 23 [Caudoviricetes sp.]
MGKLVALNTNNEEKKLKTEQPIATTVAQGQRGKLMQTGSASAPVSSPPTVYRTSPVKTTPVTQQNVVTPKNQSKLGKATFSGNRTPGKQQKYSVGKGIAGATMKGINQAAQGIADTLALAEDVALSPFELVSGQQLGDLSDSGLANKLQRRIRNEGQEIEDKYAANVERGGKAAEIFDKYGASTVAAVPQAVAAVLTSGASLGATPATLAKTAATEMAPSIANTIRNSVFAMGKDPQYWLSFSQVVGSGYEQALDDMKKSGEDNNTAHTKAALYAVGNGLMNAAVEVGGGIQTLPEQLKHGSAAWKAWLESAFEEGKEEVVQGILERATQNVAYKKGNPLASMRDENAILNPRTSAEEFLGGAVVGGVLGGGQVGANAALQSLSRFDNSLGESGRKAIRGSYQEGKDTAEHVKDFIPAYNAGVEGKENPNPTSETAYAGYVAGQNDAKKEAGTGEHIDSRTKENVSSRNVNAFQFDHPELHGYYSTAAEQIAGIADISLSRGQQKGARQRTANGYQRNNQIFETPAMRKAMDEGLTRTQIIDAAQRIINNNGQENVKAAKTLEIVLDDMLTNGYTAVDGTAVAPNTDYIAAKQQIAGAEAQTTGFDKYVTDNRLALETGEVTMDELRAEYAQQEGAEHGKAVHLRDGSERDNGADPRGEVRGVEESTGRDQSRKKGRHFADSEAASLDYGEKVSTASFGIGRGAFNDSVYLVKNETAEMRKAKDLAKKRGLRVTFFAGNNLTFRDKSGKTFQVRGYVSGDRVFIRADHPEFTSYQIMRHEAGHDMIAKGEVDLNEVRTRIDKTFTGGEVDSLCTAYADAYAGTEMTAQEIWEEVVCDSLGDMNIFADSEISDAAAFLLAHIKVESETVAQESTRAPPSGTSPVREKFSYAGEKAKNADKAALNTAKEMEKNGTDAETIRQRTGWFRGADGKWRWEIDDSGMKLRFESGLYDYNTELREKTHAWVRLTNRELTDEQRRDLADYQRSTERGEADEALYEKLAGEFGGDFEKWALTLETMKEAAKSIPNYTTLGELVDAPALFATYPDMKDMDVTFQTLERGQNGGYSRRFDSIELSRDLKNRPEALLNSLTHEVQHAVQQREGFTPGANLKYWNRKLEEGYDGRDAETRREGARLREQYEQMKADDPEFMRSMEELNAMAPTVPRGKVDMDTWEQVEPDPPEWVRFDERRDQLEEKYGDRVWDYFSLRDSIDRNARDSRLPGDLYRDTAGEIEARDAAARRGLTAEERRNRKPDTGDENTVFSDSGESYELVGKNKDGIEVYETGEDIKKMSYKERMESFMDIMRNEYAGRTAKFSDGNNTYYAKFDEADLRKNVYGDKKSSQKGWKAKINTGADGSIFELVENATYNGGKAEQGKKTQAHQNLTGWEYFVKTVQIDGQVYDLLANVRKKPDGEFVYSIQLNENKNKASAPPLQYRNGTAKANNRPVGVSTNASNGSVPQNGGNVNGVNDEQFSLEIPEANYEALKEKYGYIPAGERAYREVQVPKKTADDKYVSRTIRTVLEAKATPDAMMPTLERMVAKGEFSYDRYTDKQAISDAESRIKTEGWQKTLNKWKSSTKEGISKENTAIGWALYNNAANSGDVETAIDVLDTIVKRQRNAAQALQATRLLKQQDPSTQLYAAQRSVENLTEDLKKQYGEKAPDLKIDRDLAEKFLNAKDDDARTEAMKEIYRDIGRQMPSRFIDKWNAWRYLSMLGNPRTHVRNIVGNVGFVPAVTVKNVIGAGIESAANAVSGGKVGRTKAILTTKDAGLIKAAWSDYANIREQALGSGKYNDNVNVRQEIEEGRTVFKLKPLEAMRKFNGTALDAEDAWFSKPHYAAALAQFCKANGITAEQVAGGKGIEAAREYAIREAQKATYRDTNAFSQMISDLGRYRGDNKIKRLGSTLAEGILPFRKTPANILVRGVEYSPIGFLKSISYDLVQVQKGNMQATEMIDRAAAGLTGTGLMMLGLYMAKEGILRGSGGDDEKKKKFDELQGHQEYAMELPNGTSITLDWLAPEALPFFVGANLYEQMQANNGYLTMSDMLQAASNVTDPLLSMSCLQSLNDVFDAVGYASSGDTNALTSAVASAATSYLTQGIPTVFGQAERTGESERMTTYTDKNKFLTPDMQYALGKASARIPGVDYGQIPFIDAWGRTENSGGVAARAFNNFANPAYTSKVIDSKMEDELSRLYEATGEAKVLPQRAPKSFTVNKENKQLTGEEYVKYATKRGQTSYKIVSDLTGLASYKSMSDGDKADAVAKAYEYANIVGKMSVSNYQTDGWAAKAIDTVKKTGVSEAQYIALYLAKGGIESLKDKNGDTISNSEGLQIMELVYQQKGLSDKQRAALFEDFGVGKSIRHWNRARVDEQLAIARKKAV